VLDFLTRINANAKHNTKHLRYTLLKTFFNFVKNNIDETISNPCETPMLKKLFRTKKSTPWTILEKETVDEMIFKTANPRDRILLELMARGGMRIGEVLKICKHDVDNRKIILHEPKSGKEVETVFIPMKIADRLKDYIRNMDIPGNEPIFSIKYSAARLAVKKAGERIGVKLNPHDLRRHAATYASRSGTPIEIVSKVILRHSNLSTTQRYLGKVSDAEALHWIENLYS